MADDTVCTALVAAKAKKGWDNKQIAQAIGRDEQHVHDVLTGKAKPTPEEFKAIAGALDITDNVPSHSKHEATPTEVKP